MSEELGWGSINVDESISKTDQEASNDISKKYLIGKFLCRLEAPTPKQKDFKAYSCYAANLKMVIEDVLSFEQPITNEDGSQAIHPQTKEPLMRKMQIAADDNSFNDLYAGQFIFDEVNLYNPKEKEAMKSRRLFVAKKIGIISEESTEIKAADWQNAEARMVIVETEWNNYKTLAGEAKKNSQVMWEGYESASEAAPEKIDYSDI